MSIPIITENEKIEILNTWHVARGLYGKSRHEKLLYTIDQFMKANPNPNRSFAYKYLTGEV